LSGRFPATTMDDGIVDVQGRLPGKPYEPYGLHANQLSRYTRLSRPCNLAACGCRSYIWKAR
jgi:hypothetical protein